MISQQRCGPTYAATETYRHSEQRGADVYYPTLFCAKGSKTLVLIVADNVVSTRAGGPVSDLMA